MALSKGQKSLKKWGKEKWRTKSGKNSTVGPKATGERYIPSSAINLYQQKSMRLHQQRKEKILKLVSNILNNQNELQKK